MLRAGRQQNLSEDAIVERVVESAELADVNELRILRALFDEPTGRLIANYARHYPTALNSLVAKGHVQKAEDRYRLTPRGIESTARYLQSVFRRQASQRGEQ